MNEIDPGYSRLPTEDEVEKEATTRPEWYGSVYRAARCEFSKLWRMSLMFGLIAYVYSVLRVIKDAVVSERQIPASIQFLKLGLVTPFSIISVIIVSYYLSKTSVGNVLKMANISFGVFYLVYGITMPWHYVIEPNEFMACNFFGDGKMAFRGMTALYPVSLCVNYHTSSFLYLFSELWGSVVLSLLFLTYSNSVCTFRQSLRFVPMFYIISNVGLLLSSITMHGVAAIKDHANYYINQNMVTVVLIFSAVNSFAIYMVQRNLESKILPVPIFQITTRETKKKSKVKIGFFDGIVAMFKSKLLINISFIVLAYNISTNLLESVYKPVMRSFATKHGINIQTTVIRTEANNQAMISLAVITILCTPFSRMVQRFGWTKTSFITPIWAIISCFLILLLAAYNTATEGENSIKLLNTWFLNNVLYLKAELWTGSVAVSGLKVCKYAFFDIAKEALSMKIPREDRSTAKSIYDGVCGKLGKTGGSCVSILVSNLCNCDDLRKGSMVLFFFIFLICAYWFRAVIYLGSKYHECVKSNTDIDMDIIGDAKDISKADPLE